MRALALSAVLIAAGCAAPDADAQSSPGRFEAIALEINSWGRPIDSWEVRADGTGLHAKRIAEGSPRSASYRLEHREFTVEAGEFARLAEMASELPRLAIADCQLRAIDLPYGTLRLSRAGAEEEISFDTGCQDARYRAFVAQLTAMDELVTGWAEQHSPTRIEERRAR
jgi:hypothetical protein